MAVLFLSSSSLALDSVKLADFGLSLAVHGNFEPASYVGTRIYTAPVSDFNFHGTRKLKHVSDR